MEGVSLRWVRGYTSQTVQFINNNTVCYPCGNYMMFVATDTGKESLLHCSSGGIGVFTVHQTHQMVAFSEQRWLPAIFIYTFPDLNKISSLKGGAKLDYSLLSFSYSGPYFASYSSIPDFILTIWDWRKGTQLCSESTHHLVATALTFNPMNQFQFCTSSEDTLILWTIERCSDLHILRQQHFKLLVENGSSSTPEETELSEGSTPLAYLGPEMPISAVSGLVGDKAIEFVPKNRQKRLLQPVCHCWSSASTLYVGCKQGQLLLTEPDKQTLVLLQVHKPNTDSWVLKPGSVDSLALYKGGLFAGGTDGQLLLLHVRGREVDVELCWQSTKPVLNIAFSSDYQALVVATTVGTVNIYHPGNQKVTELLNIGRGEFVAVDMLTPGDKYCVSARASGDVQVWSLDDGHLLSSLIIHTEIVASMACCPSAHCAVVGTVSGHLYYIDLTFPDSPRVVQRTFLNNQPINFLQYDQIGRFLLTAGPDGYIFILDSRPSKHFRVLGYTDVSSEIVGLSLAYEKLRRKVTVMALASPYTLDEVVGGLSLDLFEVSGDLLAAFDKATNFRGELSASRIHKLRCQLDFPLTSVALHHNNYLYGYCNATKSIHKFLITRDESRGIFSLTPQVKVEGHQLAPGRLLLSPSCQWLLSVGRDGFLKIRDVGRLEKSLKIQCHSYRTEGVRTVAFSLDCRHLVTTGQGDGALVCLGVSFEMVIPAKTKASLDYTTSLTNALEKVYTSENLVLKAKTNWIMISRVSQSHRSSSITDPMYLFHSSSSFGDQVNPDNEKTDFALRRDSSKEANWDTTWIQRKMEESIWQDNRKNAEEKANLRAGILQLRNTIQKMLQENEELPKIKRLDRQEFNLDLEEQKQLQKEGEAQVAKVREQIELDQLANQYLRQVVKRECWDKMTVKGRSLEAFHSGLEVTNYPMRAQNQGELKLLQRILHLRKTEIADIQARKEIVEIVLKQEKEEEEGDEEDVTVSESPALQGSLSGEHGLSNPHLYSQFHMHTKEERLNQICMLKNIIHNIKMEFNKDFEAVYKQKEQEIARVSSKNERIVEIMDQLRITEDMWEPGLSNNEKPERDLVVQDSEITAVKYLTPEQQHRMEEEAIAEEERRLAAKADNLRERALNDMMGGVLEVKKSDILRMELPSLPFMVKPDYEWTEEQKRQAKEHLVKEQELNEEKDKYRKTLESEMRKLQASVTEATHAFDDVFTKLFDKKIKSEMIIYQEELKITNLVVIVLCCEEINTWEAELNYLVNENVKHKEESERSLEETKIRVDQYREAYDDLVAEDKLLDRGFRKEFFELNAHTVDLLYKQFKRRPRIQRTRTEVETANPFYTELLLGKDPHVEMMEAMDALDTPDHLPEGVDITVWQRVCDIRRTKVESEYQVKQKSLVLAEMQAFQQKRLEEDEKYVEKLSHLRQQLSKLRDVKAQFQLNLMIQFLLKQGQVEVQSGDFIPNYSSSILLHRKVLEDLNTTIQTYGEQKVANMVESKDFRKGIIQLEWEHMKMKMQMEDLHNKTRDIQKLLITREIQEYLRQQDNEARVANQIVVMEQTLKKQEKVYEKDVREKQRSSRQLEKKMICKKLQNQSLTLQLKEVQISVAERQEIQDTMSSDESGTISQNRYVEIVQRRRLMELAKNQAEEISFLRAEVDRLRLKTFPALQTQPQ